MTAGIIKPDQERNSKVKKSIRHKRAGTGPAKHFSAALSLVMAATLTVAPAVAQELIKSIGEGEGQLDVLAWPGVLERGETDPRFDWVTPFEKATGCKLNVKLATTSDEMVALMNRGTFDLVTASGDASLRLVATGKLQPLNLDLIPNFELVDERMKAASWHTVDGVTYGTPYMWGPNVLGYNTEVFKEPPTSWGVVFKEQIYPDGKSNKGRVSAYAGPIYIADAALYLMQAKPELGIKDPYELNEAQYAEVIALLKEQRTLVGRYWSDGMAQAEDYKNEGLAASQSWTYQIRALQGEGKPFSSTVPKEGATGWADTLMMHINAPHPNCTYKFLDHSLTAKVQGDIAAWYRSLPTVPAACKGHDLLPDDGCVKQGWNDFDKIALWRTPTAKCASQNDACVPYSRWVKDYLAIMGQ
jgi:putative spermidine/putrescine transport system substrate-binding protein